MSPRKPNLQPKPSPTGAQDPSLALQASIDRLARSLAVLAVYSSPYRDKPDTERIPFLAALGFEGGDIAAILDTTPGTVQKQLSLARTGPRKKKAPPKKANGNAKDQPRAS